MRLGFDEEELALRDTVAGLLAKEVTPGAEPASLRMLWKQLAEVGVQGLAAPRDAGGSGAPLETVALVLAEAGRAALPLPLADTAAAGVPLLAAAGDPGGHLAGLIDGSLVLSLASSELVPAASLTDLFLLESSNLFTRQEVELEPAQSVDPARDLARVHPKPGAKGLALDAPPAELRDRAAVAAAAELVGLARAMVAMAVEHVKERRQFGVPVGSFQAVKHRLADAHVQVEFAAPAVWTAAWQLERRTAEAGRAASVAKVLASEAAWAAGRAALQSHGALGYTVEYRLHLWMKRAWCLASTHGSAQWHLDRIGGELGV